MPVYVYELTNGAQGDYGMASAYKVLKPELLPWNDEVQVTYTVTAVIVTGSLKHTAGISVL